jgi:hypothetical protein
MAGFDHRRRHLQIAAGRNPAARRGSVAKAFDGGDIRSIREPLRLPQDAIGN